MKISNETKVGALTATAITLLVLGYNFLKGNNLFTKNHIVYAKFEHIGKLALSNTVRLNGYRIGSVYDIEPADNKLSFIVVSINLKSLLEIPKNSVAIISSDPLGSSALDIIRGDAEEMLKEGDTLLTRNNPALLDVISGSIDPVLARVRGSLDSLQLLLGNVNSALDRDVKRNLAKVLSNLAVSSSYLNQLLDPQKGDLAKTLNNFESVSHTLKNNSGKIDSITSNFKAVSDDLAKASLSEMVKNLNNTILTLQDVLAKVNNNEGSLGLLLNDKKLYNSLTSTSRSLNTLLDDMKLHPKRYINVSVFGKKDKTQPLTAPLSDSANQSN